jgi:serine/threonine protein kinase
MCHAIYSARRSEIQNRGRQISPYYQGKSCDASDALASERHNHSVPIYEVLQVPDDQDKIILVMPLLRAFYDPPFDTIGEVVDFFRQVFEAGLIHIAFLCPFDECLQGLQFIHRHHVAHRFVFPPTVKR